MPPKGSRGRPGKAGSTNGDNSELKIPAAAVTSPKNDNEPMISPTKPECPDENPDASDSDNSDFNEGDSLKMLKKILINQKVAEKKSDERLAKLTKAFKESKKSLDAYKDTNDKVVAEIRQTAELTVKDLRDLEEKVNDLQTNLDTTKNKLADTQKLLDDTRLDLKAKAKTLDKLERKHDKDEEELKRSLLLMDGINERDHKRPIVVVQALLTDLGITYKDGDIKSAYRLGALKTGITRPRTIKVQFSNSSLKGEIFKNISKLKKNDNWKGVHLNDALSPKELQQSKDLRCIFAAGKAQGLDIKLRGNVLFIDGIRLTYRDIDNLPYGLSMESVKVIKVSDGYAFQSHHAYLSNMYMVDIKYEGQTYKSAEHLYTAEFARHHDRLELIQEILETEDGYAAKRLIRNMKANDTWDDAKFKIMRKIITLKFDQNNSIRDKLLSTSGFLYEATKDTEFGCGLTLGQNKDIKQDNIKGKNMLGKILCEYRNDILGSNN